jgi:hypothetical protein
MKHFKEGASNKSLETSGLVISRGMFVVNGRETQATSVDIQVTLDESIQTIQGTLYCYFILLVKGTIPTLTTAAHLVVCWSLLRVTRVRLSVSLFIVVSVMALQSVKFHLIFTPMHQFILFIPLFQRFPNVYSLRPLELFHERIAPPPPE